jgi:hypothetical protein
MPLVTVTMLTQEGLQAAGCGNLGEPQMLGASSQSRGEITALPHRCHYLRLSEEFGLQWTSSTAWRVPAQARAQDVERDGVC